MWFLIIVISISLGIWKFPFINYYARKAMEGNIGCGVDNECDKCNVCLFAVAAAALAIIFIPLISLWVYVIKPTGAKVSMWQKERIELYKKMMEDDK